MSAIDARLYLVAPARLAAGDLAALVPELVEAGVDLIQLREKDMEAGDLLRLGAPIAAACADAGIPFIINDRPDVALALGAPGVHLGVNDLPTKWARRVLGSALVGRSTHSEDDIRRTLDEEDPDYIAVGPTFATPTKPGRPAAGLDLLRFATANVQLPWFAIGGINEGTLPEVLEAGARRIVVVRAITESDDPPGAARRLRAMLPD
ncbi:MAG: thiamine phosphate synthase [Actinomycetota bacterium]